MHDLACFIFDLLVGHVGGEVQNNILSVLLWAPANVGERHCLVCHERLVAGQEYNDIKILDEDACNTWVIKWQSP